MSQETPLMSTRDVPTVMMCFESPNNEDAQRLIRQLDEDLIGRYPALPEPHGLRPRDLIDPSFTFVIARIDGIAVGCGALRSLPPDMGEIKRMFVLPDFRGRGIARRILEVLESRARELRFRSVCLETGIGQPEAIALYKSAGYGRIAGFGEYAGDPFSICLKKRLL
jgi:putative acetyltransferase